MAELQRRGVPFPATAIKADLFKLLQNTQNALSDSPSPNLDLDHHSNESVDVQVTLANLTASVAAIHARLDMMQTPPQVFQQAGQVLGPEVEQGMFFPPIPTRARPFITPAHFIPNQLRKDILEGKDINLVSLLISSKDGMENKAFSCEQLSVVLKARDPRLGKKLTIPEFVLAFSIFRDVICSQHPSRREELDLYLYRVVELGYRYRGSAFYDYHRSFSAKVAAALAQFNCLTNWSQLDMELFCQHFAGLQAPVYSVCQSTEHTSGFCPNSSTNEPSTSQANAQAKPLSSPRPSRKTTDRLGRPIVYVGKDQICNNYNYTGCVFSACRLLNLCVRSICQGQSDGLGEPGYRGSTAGGEGHSAEAASEKGYSLENL
ncbi:uncharacterized protein WCC33_017919 [Rhinophrynus dorsalis]